MGIENRDYLRDSPGPSYNHGGGGAAFQQSTPPVVKRVLMVSIGVFLLQWITISRQGSWVTGWLNFNPDDVLYRGQIWRMLTYGFCHDVNSLLHIVFNMVVFWMFGRRLEQKYGGREFLMFYLFAVFFAAAVHMVFGIFMNQPAAMVGASGGVMAVITLYAMNWPRDRVYIWGVIPAQMRWLAIILVLLDLLPVMGVEMPWNDRVAHMAHLGGVMFAFLYATQAMQLERILAGGLIGKRSRPTVRAQKKSGLRVFNPENKPQPNLEEETDRLLEKISRDGADSLSPKERAILNEASRKIRDKR